jgi:hypothetical protein
VALGRKGSRRIVVDSTAYRWRLRRRPTYIPALCWTRCGFAVEHADADGTTLMVTTNQPHASNWTGREAQPVLPSDVAQANRRRVRQPDRGAGVHLRPASLMSAVDVRSLLIRSSGEIGRWRSYGRRGGL